MRDRTFCILRGQVTAMHDPTEGGLAAALWELAEASDRQLIIDVTAIPIQPLSARICTVFDLDPLAAIASGALLLTAPAIDTPHIQRALLEKADISCATIGVVTDGPPAVYCQTKSGYAPLHRPARDEIVQVFQAKE